MVKKIIFLFIFITMVLSSCSINQQVYNTKGSYEEYVGINDIASEMNETIIDDANDSRIMENKTISNETMIVDSFVEEAYFAGGCFWGMQSNFEEWNNLGIINVTSGYSGGVGHEIMYSNYGEKNFTEAIKVVYDSSIVSYIDLLQFYWTTIDPLDSKGQFCDKGNEYISIIYYTNDEQKKFAEESKIEVEKVLGQSVYTKIQKFKNFGIAEEYHQDYYKKNPIRYNYYRKACGRDSRVNTVWSGKNLDLSNLFSIVNGGMNMSVDRYSTYVKPDEKTLRNILTPLQYKVTQEEGTEKPFDNEYWDNHEEGIYVDILSGEPLFSSKDKYESGTGWPSFTRPIDSNYIVEKEDFKLIYTRTEVRSKYGDNHLGHVFNDGPTADENPSGTGLRYCMDSASLKFISKDEMEEKGYGKYLVLFN